MLEYFVHIDTEDAPPDLMLVTAEIPNDMAKVVVGEAALTPRWRDSPAPAELAAIGDEFVQKGECCILVVSSALAPHENNWLLNPQHAGFGKIVVSRVEALRYDPRMFAPQGRRRRSK